jgi:hypothetical protein
MAFPEGLPAHVQVLQATIQPAGLMDRTPQIYQVPSRLLQWTPQAGWRHAGGRGFVEWQWGAV